MFELLFKYPRAIWQDATLVFDSGWSLTGLVAGITVALILIIFTLWERNLSTRRRSLVGLLQTLVAAVALAMLWQPALKVSLAEQGDNSVAWVLDSSASMSIADAWPDKGNQASAITRLAAGIDVIGAHAVDDSLNFNTSLFALGEELTSVDSIEALASVSLSSRSGLSAGLETLLNTVNQTSLAAVVLLSDGADNIGKVDTAWWQKLAAAGVPIHTIGIGQSSDRDDIELSDVALPDRVQSNVSVNARLRVAHGTSGSVRVRITSGDDLLLAEDITLPEGVDESVHTVSFPSGESGVKQLNFSILREVPGTASNSTADPVERIPESNLANNRQPRILQVVDAPQRILYVEGEPRWEYKFLRRALADHPSVEVVSLLRTSPNKFYRQGVADANELAEGFPTVREQLFSYDAVIIGSLEAAELTTAQQTALRDFVSIRGGSLLMLGGRRGLADGGWARSVTAAALPVVLNSRLNSSTYMRERSTVLPTLAGLRTPWLQLGDDESANLAAWQELPELGDVQSVGSPKPGAEILLESTFSGGAQPLLVWQRYGRGSSAVLGTSGTWRWQMSLPSDDQKHERFWRQLLSALADKAVPRLAIDTRAPVVRDAEQTTLAVIAYNADYSALQQSVLDVRLTRPDGSLQTAQLLRDAERPGRYMGAVPSDQDGPWSMEVTTPLGGEAPAAKPLTAQSWWVRESGNAERFGATLQAGFLRRIAETTGGSYLPLANSSRLDEVLSRENAALKRETRLELWNMPFFFLCIALAKALEWGLRLRWKRL